VIELGSEHWLPAGGVHSGKEPGDADIERARQSKIANTKEDIRTHGRSGRLVNEGGSNVLDVCPLILPQGRLVRSHHATDRLAEIVRTEVLKVLKADELSDQAAKLSVAIPVKGERAGGVGEPSSGSLRHDGAASCL